MLTVIFPVVVWACTGQRQTIVLSAYRASVAGNKFRTFKKKPPHSLFHKGLEKSLLCDVATVR